MATINFGFYNKLIAAVHIYVIKPFIVVMLKNFAKTPVFQ